MSNDGKYLIIDAACNKYCKFESIILRHYKDKYIGVSLSELIDISSDVTKIKYILELEDFRKYFPSWKDSDDKMFYIEFSARCLSDEDTESYLVEKEKTEGLEPVKLVVVSDVSSVYNYLIDTIISDIDTRCFEVSDIVQKMLVTLYAHTEAMKLDLYDLAEYFYDILVKKFTNCYKGSCYSYKVNSKIDCGCHG